MKRIGTKLLGGFMLLIALILVLSFYAIYMSQKSLRESIGSSSVFLADEILKSINQAISLKVEQLESFIEYSVVKDAVRESNDEFGRMAGLEDVLARREKEWNASAEENGTSLAGKVMEGEFSRRLKSGFIDFYTKQYGSRPFARIYVTNKYGAIMETTGKTSLYVRDKEEWWKTAREKDVYIGTIGVNESININTLPVALRIDDTDGSFLGVLRADLAANEIIDKTITANKRYETTQIRLVTHEGRLIFSTKAFRFLEDVSGEPFFKGLRGGAGSFTAMEGGRRILFSYIKSPGTGNLRGIDWILVVGHDAGEVLKASYALRTNLVLAAAVLTALGLLISFFISGSITKPLGVLKAAAEEIARGEMTKEIRIKSKDEIGGLALAFNGMNESLKEMTEVAEKIAAGDLTVEVRLRSDNDILAKALSGMVVGLREQIKKILEGANVITSSSQEIFAAVSQYASNSSETATAVTETSTSVEEIKQTAHVSNQKAKKVSETAQKTAQIYQDGREAVEKTGDIMRKVKEQMESIAAGIMTLSEQSQAIDEITLVVNDVADQTNLLAVNAAIEASKAGEQGKGFSVVAQEIKNLAAQSKKATGQVRGILQEVQKATASAVMSTEQGGRTVDAGLKQSVEAGEAIRQLAENMEIAAEASVQIAASSNQQLIGMDQVAIAMESIKQASNIMASGTQQLESGARNLTELGTRLKELVGQYVM